MKKVATLTVMACTLLSGCGRESATAGSAAQMFSNTDPVVTPELHLAQAAVIAPPIEVPLIQTSPCLAKMPVQLGQPSTVHRWTDSAGIVHYSDQPPPPGAKDPRLIEVSDLPPVKVVASGYDVNLPDQLQQRAVADVLEVQRVMRDRLGVDVPSGMVLRIVFARAAGTYAQLVGDPVLSDSAGAYSAARQTIYVRMQFRDEVNFAILRHEITHALVHESIGNLPTPINEGLAEYFARYRSDGTGGRFDLATYRKAIIDAAPAGDGTDALVDLFARNGDDFYSVKTGSKERERRYLRAYALIAQLMRDTTGRAALAAILATQHLDPCHPVAAETVLDAHFPGGLLALAQAWAAYMRDPPADGSVN